MRILCLLVMALVCTTALSPMSHAQEQSAPPTPPAAGSQPTRPPSPEDRRLELFQQMECLYGIRWTYLAAIDQYERSLRRTKKQDPASSARLTAISISPNIWSGYGNPDPDDTAPASIAFFGGIGTDGSGDGRADRQDDVDVLTSLIQFLSQFGYYSREDFRIGVWTYYKRDRAVKTIDQFVTLYEKYQTLHIDGHAFPIPKQYRYSYRSTWGDARGWGGRRIHEGTDIFADYGTPVRSTSYGIVEVMGWNRYGGWRIGIRDLDNIYHYYAHLSAFRKGLKAGDIVEPGQIIGYVGSSGYGKPGTSGKFPPHLHYGMYKDNGSTEWAFNPYPYLKRWELESKKRK